MGARYRKGGKAAVPPLCLRSRFFLGLRWEGHWGSGFVGNQSAGEARPPSQALTGASSVRALGLRRRTAAATDSVGNTSEFSLNVQTPVNSPPVAKAGGP